ncbi:pseudaminic acid synthase [Aquirufa ecclesiirivi]|uniref:pseudaminic acid synthase n=1 Tax=Aquirufa ecclesiirivi TaxID=2715124 RepID=UPI0022A88C42|nr:pseudaminic acid synthase [Aquirufa ecclesiirivi]MCZ2473327.1 pseudaminic acid synthase [Aquirufa ecclesiirivi]
MLNRDIKLGNFVIGDNHAPFVIAEMSGNHNQSLERALEIVQAAAKSGAHALKLQTYTADTMTIKGALTIEDPDSLWKGRELYELYEEAYTPWEWHKPIFDLAKELGMVAFSTPFDETAVDFLEDLGVEAYKIASFENTDWPLLKKVAQTKKPVIMSTGAATIADIDDAVRILRSNGCTDLVLLKCTSTYPSTPKTTNLNTIPHLKQVFTCHVGLSDHTMGIGAAVASVALGARVVEKHFTLSRADGGVDSAFSMEPEEMKALVIESERAFQSLGIVQFNVQEAEKKSLRYKRSLYAVEEIKSGEVFTKQNIRAIRPGDGLATKFYDIIIGKKASKNIEKGTPLSWDNI